jgi:hypothetical protein
VSGPLNRAAHIDRVQLHWPLTRLHVTGSSLHAVKLLLYRCPCVPAAAVVAVAAAKQARLQELVQASELLRDMPSLADPAWLSAGE